MFRFHDVLRRHPNQPVPVGQRWHVADVLHVRHGVGRRRDLPLCLSAGDKEQDHERLDVISRQTLIVFVVSGGSGGSRTTSPESSWC